MRSLLVVMLVACGDKSSCPSAEALIGNDSTTREAAIVVARCKADGWSRQVTDCLAGAGANREAQEKCFHALTAAQRSSLHKAFEPVADELDAQERTITLAMLDHDIAALRLEELVARAPSCADLRIALQTARSALAKCTRPSSLEVYGVTQQAKRGVETLRKMVDPEQLGAECAKQARATTIYGDGCD